MIPRQLTMVLAIRIMMGASVGLPAASLCINRRLYCISSAQAVSITRADVRPRTYILFEPYSFIS